MARNLKKTLGAKVVALGFIAMILLGNAWLVLAVLSAPVAGWIYDLFLLLAAVVILGGIAMFVEMFISPLDLDEGSDNEGPQGS